MTGWQMNANTRFEKHTFLKKKETANNVISFSILVSKPGSDTEQSLLDPSGPRLH